MRLSKSGGRRRGEGRARGVGGARRAPRQGRRRKGGPKPHGLARWISKFGILSRAEAERCVHSGRVSLNGRIVRDPERACHPEVDRILLDGRVIRPARRIYLAMNKPRGYITTARDPQGRLTVYDLLPPESGSAQAVGRLDVDTSGLILFTNDTLFASRVTDSSSGVEKVYQVRLRGEVATEDVRCFEQGIVLDGQRTLPARCRILGHDGGSTRVEVILTEGRNRQVRRMWEVLGHEVLDLHRVRIGPVGLGSLPPGKTRRLSEFERVALERKE